MSSELIHDDIKIGLGSLGLHPILQKYVYLELNVSNKDLIDISLIQNFPQLMYINFSNNKIKNIENVLDKLSYLTQLDLSNNDIDGKCLDFMPLKCSSSNNNDNEKNINKYKNIGSILISSNLNNNNITSIENLDERHPYLEFLLLSNNQITNINTGLNSLSYLKVLDLSYNKISMIPIEGSVNNLPLLELNLEGNLLEDITALGKLKKLSTLNCSNNLIKNMKSLKDCTNLTYLDIRNNKIDILRHVEIFINNNFLQTIKFEGNPASIKPFYRERLIYRLPKLRKLDSITISSNERIRCQNLYNTDKGDIFLRKEIFNVTFPNEEFINRTPYVNFIDEEEELTINEIHSGEIKCSLLPEDKTSREIFNMSSNLINNVIGNITT